MREGVSACYIHVFKTMSKIWSTTVVRSRRKYLLVLRYEAVGDARKGVLLRRRPGILTHGRRLLCPHVIWARRAFWGQKLFPQGWFGLSRAEARWGVVCSGRRFDVPLLHASAFCGSRRRWWFKM